MLLFTNYFNAFEWGLVTGNLVAGMKTLKAMCGASDFAASRDTLLSAAGPYTVDIAVADVGGVMFELLAPVGGADGVYRVFVVPGQPGAVRLHHFAHVVETQSDWDNVIASIDASGLATPLRGLYLDKAHYVCVDTRAMIGHYTEFVYLTEAGRGLWHSQGFYVAPYARLFTEIRARIEGDEPPLPERAATFEDAARVQAVIDAVRLSSRERRWIDL